MVGLPQFQQVLDEDKLRLPVFPFLPLFPDGVDEQGPFDGLHLNGVLVKDHSDAVRALQEVRARPLAWHVPEVHRLPALVHRLHHPPEAVLLLCVRAEALGFFPQALALASLMSGASLRETGATNSAALEYSSEQRGKNKNTRKEKEALHNSTNALGMLEN